jgi:hypothetical protein
MWGCAGGRVGRGEGVCCRVEVWGCWSGQPASGGEGRGAVMGVAQHVPAAHLNCSPSCVRVPTLAAPKHAIKWVAELAIDKQRLPLEPAAADCNSLHLRCSCIAPLEAAASGAAAP